MLKKTKKYLRHNKKKKGTHKKILPTKSKTLKGKGKRKIINLKNKTLKKQKGGVPADVSAHDPTVGESLRVLRENEKIFRDNEKAQKRRIEEQNQSELLKSLSSPSRSVSDDPSYEIPLTGVPPDEELDVNEVETFLNEELGSEIPQNTINSLAEQIVENPEMGDISQTIVDTIPPSQKNKTMKRLKYGLQTFKDNFTRRRRPTVYKGPGVQNPLFEMPTQNKERELNVIRKPTIAQIENPAQIKETSFTSVPIAETSFTSVPSEETSFTSVPSAETSFPTAETSFPTAVSGDLVAQPSDPLESQPSEGPLDPLFSYEFINNELSDETFEEQPIDTDSSGSQILEPFPETLEVLDEYAQEKVVERIGEGLNITEPTPDKIEAELKKPEKSGIFAKISQSMKNIMRKIGLSKDKTTTTEIKEDIKDKLESDQFTELNKDLKSVVSGDVIDYLYNAIIENGKTSVEIIEELRQTSSEMRENQELYDKLNDLRNEMLSDAVKDIETKTQNKLEELETELTSLIRENASIKLKMDELAETENPVIIEQISTGISGEELKNLISVLLSKKMEELKMAVPDEKIRNDIEILSQRVRNLTLENLMLKELREDAMMQQPPRWTPVQQPQAQFTPQQAQFTPQQPTQPPQIMTQSPQIMTQQEMKPTKESSEQVISISPEQLLDNKTIVIKIMMPRGAQIDTASDTGNTAEEQISSVINLSGKEKEVQQGAKRLIEKSEQINDTPPPYIEGGQKSMDPARIHPASLF